MAKPSVDGVERQFESRMNVARIDVTSPEGRVIAGRYAISAIPAFVIVDPHGNVLFRQIGGTISSQQVQQALNSAQR